MSIDFRNFYCNEKIKSCMGIIYNRVHKSSPINDELDNLKAYLQSFFEESLDKDQARKKSEEVFSEFLQNLVYYSYHNVEDVDTNLNKKTYVEKMVFALLTRKEFCSHFWIDPKTGATALTSLCRNNDALNSKLLVRQAKKNPDYKNYLFHADKTECTALDRARDSKNPALVEFLLREISEARGEENQENRTLFSYETSCEEVKHSAPKTTSTKRPLSDISNTPEISKPKLSAFEDSDEEWWNHDSENPAWEPETFAQKKSSASKRSILHTDENKTSPSHVFSIWKRNKTPGRNEECRTLEVVRRKSSLPVRKF